MNRELEIINACLLEIGIATVDSIDTTDEDIRDAQNILKRELRKLQSVGWWFNTVEKALIPDTNKYIYIPANAVSIDPIKSVHRDRYITLGDKIFDKVEDTYEITEPLICEIKYSFSIDIIPMLAFNDVLANTVYQYTRIKGQAENRANMLYNEWKIARNQLMTEHLSHVEYSSIDNPITAALISINSFTREV